mgnify:CR=1 FL=1
MKILLVNVVYGKGSTGNITQNLFSSLKGMDSDVSVIFGRGKANKQENVFCETIELESKIHHFNSMIFGNIFGGMYFSTKRIISRINKIKPDVVNVHCINGYFVNIFKLLEYLAKNKIKTVLTMHADFMMTGGCGYSLDCENYLTKKCKNCKFARDFAGFSCSKCAHRTYLKFEKTISLFNRENLKITTVSDWLTKRYKASPIYKDFDICTILNPVDKEYLGNFGENPYKTKNNILYVTPDIYDHVKSGFLINDLAKIRKDLHFTVVCAKNIDYKFTEDNITYIKGGLDKTELKNFYYYADATVLLSKRETFSMVVAESLVCGTPVYGFKSGGPETIAIDKYCNFFDYGNIKELAENLLRTTFDKKLIVEDAKHKYSIASISNQYLKIYSFKNNY